MPHPHEAPLDREFAFAYHGGVAGSPSTGRSLADMSAALRDFAIRRDWEQFHSPRNLMLALVGEIGELAAEFQWLSDDEIQQLVENRKLESMGSELADVLSYLLRLADVLGIDIDSELTKKMEANELRYPQERARGSAKKYTAYE